jgi:hypothetical protein
MNKKIILLFNFLNKLGIKDAQVNFGIWSGEMDYMDEDISNENGQSITIPAPFNTYIQDLLYEYIDEIHEDSYSDDTGFRDVNMIFDLKNYKIIMRVKANYYDNESDGASFELNQLDEWHKMVNEVFDKLNYNGEIALPYEGSGGWGSVSSEMELINGGKVIPVDENLQRIADEFINEYFKGWKREDGSQGTVYFNREEVWAEHTWNLEKSRECSPNIIINLKDNN